MSYHMFEKKIFYVGDMDFLYTTNRRKTKLKFLNFIAEMQCLVLND